MYLHEAMREILASAAGHRLTPSDLCEQVDRRGLYRMRDGRRVEVQQIHARVANYPELFRRAGGYVELVEPSGVRGVPPRSAPAVTSTANIELRATTAARPWPWEGAVQAVLVEVLTSQGWTVSRTADTATKETGVDVLADKGERHLGAEVKGYPSTEYSDPRRAGERKRTSPSAQARHWFDGAVGSALRLLGSHGGHESLVVLPDHPRYRDLAARSDIGLGRAGIHVVFLRPDGRFDSATWRP